MSQVTKSRYKECSGPDGAGEPDVRGARLLVRQDGVRVLVVVEQNGLGGPAQQTVFIRAGNEGPRSLVFTVTGEGPY